MQAPERGLLAPDLVLYLDIPPEVICFHYIFNCCNCENNKNILIIYDFEYFVILCTGIFSSCG